MSGEEVQARVVGVQQRLDAPACGFEVTLPGLFAGDPPDDFLPLLQEMAAGVRMESMRTALRVMAAADQRDLLPRIAVPTLLIWGDLDVALVADRRAPVRAGDPRRKARCDPGRRSLE